jgi:uncharacterized protein (DUF488 family)
VANGLGSTCFDAAHEAQWSMDAPKSWSGIRLWTVGHSTRTLAELVALLKSFEIGVLADIRTVPRSRKNPQFNRETLPVGLEPHGIRYAHLKRLGGLRHARKDSPNVGWRNENFRGFADYALTEDFETGLTELRTLTEQGRVSLMCAEAVPWRCHRSLVADVVTARGGAVEHIMAAGRSNSHVLTSFAKVDGERVTYPAILD